MSAAQEELSQKFHDEFPDGVVPVRIALGHAEADGALEWMEATHADLVALDDLGVDVRTIDKAREQWAEGRRNRAVLSCTRSGLSLRETARYLEVAPERVIAEVGSQNLDHSTVDLLDADDMLMEGTDAEEAAMHTGLPLRAVYSLETLHTGVTHRVCR